jgi:hypothetical protein
VSAKKHITLTLKPGAGAARIAPEEVTGIVYFTEDGMVDSDKPQNAELLPDGSLRFTLVEAEYIVGERPATLSAVLLRKAGWEAGGGLRCLRVTPSLVSQASDPLRR